MNMKEIISYSIVAIVLVIVVSILLILYENNMCS